ncbi:hypothetical protein H9P43_003038 [Blastocladiella emersonii ATCC 22665]|nr:hypothetical protein H9P43_003038 [Blastocladiella emersonii ATCC 22665]
MASRALQGPAAAAAAATRTVLSSSAASSAAASHQQRSLSGSRPADAGLQQAGSMGKSAEEVMAMISSITANLTKNAASASSSGSSSSTSASAPQTLVPPAFPTTRASIGLSGRAPPAPASAAHAHAPSLPSFTPASAALDPGLVAHPPTAPRKSQALFKLNSFAPGAAFASPLASVATPSPFALGAAASAVAAGGVARNAGFPRAGEKIDLSFLDSPSTPGVGGRGSPKSLTESAAASPSAAGAVDWDSLISEFQQAPSKTAPAPPSSSPSPLDIPRSVAAAVAKPTAPHQLPDFSALSTHLAAATATARASAASASPSARSALALAMQSASDSSAAAWTLAPRLARDDVTALLVQLRAVTSSAVHLRGFLATLFRYLPHPPAAVIADAVRAAGELGQPHLAYAILAQVRRQGLLAMVRSVDAGVYEALVRVAWTNERSMARVIRYLRDMAGIGVTPSRSMVLALDQILAARNSKSSVAAAWEAEGKSGPAAAKALPAASKADADLLWRTLCELNLTRFFQTRVRAPAARMPTATVAESLPEQSLAVLAGKSRAGTGGALLSGQGLADLVRSTGAV